VPPHDADDAPGIISSPAKPGAVLRIKDKKLNCLNRNLQQVQGRLPQERRAVLVRTQGSVLSRPPHDSRPGRVQADVMVTDISRRAWRPWTVKLPAALATAVRFSLTRSAG
jgi:hypothetical protein